LIDYGEGRGQRKSGVVREGGGAREEIERKREEGKRKREKEKRGRADH
jgi:hypothetical protein